MIITTSKNSNKENKKIAKSLSSVIYGLVYHSRKNFSLQKFIEKTKKENENGIIVLSKNENLILNKYYYDKKNKIFRWSDASLEIKKIKFFVSKIEIVEPVKIKIKKREEKKLAKFFEIEQNPLTNIYLEPEQKYEIKVNKNRACFYYNKKKLFKFEYRWVNV